MIGRLVDEVISLIRLTDLTSIDNYNKEMQNNQKQNY
jgi:hypothetical protein